LLRNGRIYHGAKPAGRPSSPCIPATDEHDRLDYVSRDEFAGSVQHLCRSNAVREVVIPEEVRERIGRWRGRIHPFEKIDAARTALLVVDMQVAFLAPGAAGEVAAAREIVPNINRLAAALRNAGGHVVWLISTYGPASEDRWSVLFDHIFSREHGERFRAALTEGAPGHAIWPELDRQVHEAVVKKNRFGGFSGSRGELEALLRAKGVDTVIVTGAVTNVCCETTAREAVMADFKTIMVSDGNAGRSPENDQRTYAAFLQAFGDVLTTDQVLRGIGAAQASQRR
jgi:ureidoacrylate peracid hydrolase